MVAEHSQCCIVCLQHPGFHSDSQQFRCPATLPCRLATGQLQSTSDQLASVSAEHTHAAAELSVLSAQHSALVPERNRLDADLKAMKVQLVELEGRHSTLSSQLKASSEECAVLKTRCEKEEQDHAAAKQALLTSQEARIAAEVGLQCWSVADSRFA